MLAQKFPGKLFFLDSLLRTLAVELQELLPTHCQKLALSPLIIRYQEEMIKADGFSMVQLLSQQIVMCFDESTHDRLVCNLLPLVCHPNCGSPNFFLHISQEHPAQEASSAQACRESSAPAA